MLLFAMLTIALALPSAPALGAVRSFEISQTALLDGSPSALRVYARVLDERNEPLFTLGDATLEATVGDRRLELLQVRSFHESDEGVAYIFLVDISRSLSEREFALIRESLETWMIGLRSQDRAAILAFGDESRLVADFTNDAQALRESLGALGPTDSSTVFFEALRDGFELARRRDADLPGRRVLIVLTDGRDEGSGWTLEDMLGVIRDDPTPIFAIGLSRIRSSEERQRYLKLLRRLATNSGGAFFEGSTETLAKSYAAIREAVHNVWVLDFACPDCVRDGRSYRLQANLSDGERVLSDGQAIRLLPTSGLALGSVAPEPSQEAPAAMLDASEETPGEPDVAGPESEGRQGADTASWNWLWLTLPLLAAAAAGWLMWTRRAPAAITPETDLATLPSVGPVEAPTYTTAGGLVTTRPPRPNKLRVVRLIVVRGNKPGTQYSVTLLDRAVLGARSSCDCVLFGEPGVSPEQFELFQRDGHVFMRNLSETNPTLIDGLPADGRQRIQTEALIGTRDFIVRVIFGEGRATARG
jgi:VWFA-related protein